ncbi:MAG: CHASE2 domain-containing protein [Burkholderiales bacterium]
MVSAKRAVSVAVLLAGAMAIILQPSLVRSVRDLLFDGYQRLYPRERKSAPAIVVAIDEPSLAEYGQWPWPRARIAELLRRIAADHPAAVGIDILFPEPDGSTPDGSGDAALARAIRGNKVVLAVAGLPYRDGRFLTPLKVAPVRLFGSNLPSLPRFNGQLQSLPELDRAAAGRGLISAVESERIIRRIPLMAQIGELYVPSLAVEMVRVAAGVDVLGLEARGGDRLVLHLGDLAIPAQGNGEFWLYFGRHDPDRIVSAAALLAGRLPAQVLRDKLVLVGVTGLGLLDQKVTPLGERVPGVEIHQQILEQVFGGQFLRRPVGASWIEAGLLLLAGLLLVGAVPAMRVWASVLSFCTVLAALCATGLVAFRNGLLLDVASPALGVVLVFGTLLAATLAEADRQRRAMREAAARVAGELQAARRIQMGLLPVPEALFEREQRFKVAALLEPARTIGGDFYDCAMIDSDRLLFVVGDVSGKGLPASLFMALSKTLLKSAAMRSGHDIGAAFIRANAEIRRENPEELFVTAFAGILDVRTGMLEYSNAGHEPPYGKQPDAPPERFEIGDGPPLCVLENHSYTTRYRQLAAGEWLCVLTDGVTEAMDPDWRLYGIERVEAVLRGVAESAEPKDIIRALHDDVQQFVHGAQASDDLTLLCLRWRGTELSGR